jgi:hypothetical protein
LSSSEYYFCLFLPSFSLHFLLAAMVYAVNPLSLETRCGFSLDACKSIEFAFSFQKFSSDMCGHGFFGLPLSYFA